MSNRRSFLLYPVSLFYGFITGFRNFLYNIKILPAVEFSIPVICIGNITVGGTGKTPHTEYLVGLLQKQYKVAVLSRGYKRTSQGFKIITASSTVADAGDEPLQMARKFRDTLVAVDRNRKKGIKKIIELFPETEVILLDDAFQRRQIIPGISILLTDFGRLMTRDFMLPYGNLRESISNKRRADAIIVTKSPADISPLQRRLIVKEIGKAPYQNLYFTSVKYDTPKPLFETTNLLSEPDFSKPNLTGVLLVTGIANPNPFKEFIETIAHEVIHLQYPDHYKFKNDDITTIAESFEKLKSPLKYIITTEKDSIRLKELDDITVRLQNSIYYFPIGVDFLNDYKNDFDKIITDYVRKNKRNNRVSEN
jgi:tetraacyldisaccharide 4'-kinase